VKGSTIVFAALGPITGPLAYYLVKRLRERRWALAAVYGAAIVETWGLLGMVAGAALLAMSGHV